MSTPHAETKIKFKKLSTVKRKIDAELAAQDGLYKTFEITDNSIQSELRVYSSWHIAVEIDHVNYPKNLKKDDSLLWDKMAIIAGQIREISRIKYKHKSLEKKINANTKSGPSRRAKEKEAFEIIMGNQFLADCRSARKELKNRIKKIAHLQKQQKSLLPKLRKANSEYLAERKALKTEQEKADMEAISSGEFWNASEKALKSYFNPPFSKNYLADVSEEWRAALFLEVESTGYKVDRSWRHKLTPTGKSYLCGIDDNGDEWGHVVNISEYMSHDDYFDYKFEADVEWAIAELFGIGSWHLPNCQRQGDLLFCPAELPDGIEMTADESWNIRETHTITSPGMERNGRYVRSTAPITVTHASHPTLHLDPGTYEIYMSVAD